MKVLVALLLVMLLAAPIEAQESEMSDLAATIIFSGSLLAIGSVLTFRTVNDGADISGTYGGQPVSLHVSDANSYPSWGMAFVNPLGSTPRRRVLYTGAGLIVTGIIVDKLLGRSPPVRVSVSERGVRASYSLGF